MWIGYHKRQEMRPLAASLDVFELTLIIREAREDIRRAAKEGVGDSARGAT